MTLRAVVGISSQTRGRSARERDSEPSRGRDISSTLGVRLRPPVLRLRDVGANPKTKSGEEARDGSMILREITGSSRVFPRCMFLCMYVYMYIYIHML